MSAKQSHEMAKMLADQINSDPYNKTFNRMVANGADSSALKAMLADFGGKEGLLKVPDSLNSKLFNKNKGMLTKVGKNLGKRFFGGLSTAAFFMVDLGNDGLEAATMNAIKDVTGYSLILEPVGEVYNEMTKSMMHNSTYGTFNGDASGAAGDFSRSLNGTRREMNPQANQ